VAWQGEMPNRCEDSLIDDLAPDEPIRGFALLAARDTSQCSRRISLHYGLPSPSLPEAAWVGSVTFQLKFEPAKLLIIKDGRGRITEKQIIFAFDSTTLMFRGVPL